MDLFAGHPEIAWNSFKQFCLVFGKHKKVY